ncbi:glycosyl hydrolase [Cysteiniphilum litorale]|uniref:Glycosyl hydrolase n=1 Tax=Cysteiniphilum litorale TaxID=2056700 RepID=A0A8J2Z5P2_9GAMM|nr:glycosyl hydrolase [Cysteiniphilum litorale]
MVNNRKQWVTGLQMMVAVAISAMSIQSSFANVVANNAMTDSFWQTQKKGANFFRQHPASLKDWQDAKQVGIEFFRIPLDAYLGYPVKLDNITQLTAFEIKSFDQNLKDAKITGIPIILSFLSLPFSVWKQQHGNHDDLRLWQDKKHWQAAGDFWAAVAKRYKANPNIVAYNILNEPHPEVLKLKNSNSAIFNVDFTSYYKKVVGTSEDLNAFYEYMVKRIRHVDPDTPIIVDAGWYAEPPAADYLKPIDAKNILYAFHMYEPYIYTTRKINNGKYVYPGKIATGNDQFSDWNKATLEKFLQPIVNFQERYHISSQQIILEEFGVDRMTKGATQYLKDIVNIANKNNWHWAFYNYRGDEWTGMNYELSVKPMKWQFWKDEEKTNLFPNLTYGKANKYYVYDKNNPLWHAVIGTMKHGS